jgi:hypothetical protein
VSIFSYAGKANINRVARKNLPHAKALLLRITFAIDVMEAGGGTQIAPTDTCGTRRDG